MKRLFKIAAISLVMPLVLGVAGFCHAAHAGSKKAPSKTVSMKESRLYKEMCDASPDAKKTDCSGRAFLVNNDGTTDFRADVLCQKGRVVSISLFSPNGASLTDWYKNPSVSGMCNKNEAAAIKAFGAKEAGFKEHLGKKKPYQMPPGFQEELIKTYKTKEAGLRKYLKKRNPTPGPH